MNDLVIKEPRFIDLEKTRVAFKILKDNGSMLSAELKVPENRQRGVNKYWDYILDNFDIEALRQERNLQELRERKLKDFNQKKRKAMEENSRLKRLFSKKMAIFELPHVKNGDETVKSAVRRAPDEQFLQFLIYNEMRKFMESNNYSYVDYLDYLDEQQDLKEEKNNSDETSISDEEETPAISNDNTDTE